MHSNNIRDHHWFHAIDFGNGVVTPGRFNDTTPPNWTLYGVLYLLEHMQTEGISCLDIGAMDGLISLILKSGGAANVVATDILNRDSFRLACEITKLEINYHPDLHVNDLPHTAANGSYDLIVFSGVLYHLYDPLGGIATCRKLMARNGLLVIETETVPGGEAVMKFTPAYNEYPEPYTYWQPTVPCLIEMLKFCSFEVITTIKTLHRTTVLARAVRPSEVGMRSDRLIKTHKETRGLGPYLDFGSIENDPSPTSEIRYTGALGACEINPRQFSSNLQYQPKWGPKHG